MNDAFTGCYSRPLDGMRLCVPSEWARISQSGGGLPQVAIQWFIGDHLPAKEPFSEEWTREAVFAIEIVYDFQMFKFRYGFFNGGGIIDMGGFKECSGGYFFAAVFGDCTQNACLQCGKLPCCKCVVVLLTGKNHLKRRSNVLFFKSGSLVAHLPERIAEFLNEARSVSGKTRDCVEYRAGEFSFPRLKPFFDEWIEICGGNISYGERCGRVIEWTGILEKDIVHLVADASKKNVWCVGVKLYLGAQYGQNPLSVINVEDVLKFVEEYANPSALCLRQKSIENSVKRHRVGGNFRVKRYRWRSRGRVYRNGRAKISQHAEYFSEPSVGFFEAGKRGDKPAAEIDLVANTEKVRMKEGDVFQMAYCFKNKRGFSSSSFALNDNILTRFYARGKFTFKHWTWAEEVSGDRATIFEWIHVSFSFLVIPNSIIPFGIIPFGITQISIAHKGVDVQLGIFRDSGREILPDLKGETHHFCHIQFLKSSIFNEDASMVKLKKAITLQMISRHGFEIGLVHMILKDSIKDCRLREEESELRKEYLKKR